MAVKKVWTCFLCIFCLFSLGNEAVAKAEFTLEQVLSAPYPMHLTAAKNADRIAWVFSTEGVLNVWTAAAPGFAPVRLTDFKKNAVFEIPSVHITDDGNLVVYVRGGNPNREGWVTNPTSDPDGVEQAIWAIDVQNKETWKVANGNDPVLSPDGKWILFSQKGNIYRVSLPAGEISSPEQLFKARGQNTDPHWSPDGKKVAFLSRRNAHNFIGVYDIGRHNITWMAPGVDKDSDPRWTADGRQVVFFRRPGSQFDEMPAFREIPDTAIWIADAGTGKGKELWKQAPNEQPRYLGIRELFVTAGGRVLFWGEHDNWYHVFSLPLSGGPPVDLTPGEGFVEHKDISSDGRMLFFSSNRADIHGRHIWKVPTSGGKAVQLTDGAAIGTYPVGLASGKQIAFLHATATYPTSVAIVPSEGGKTRLIAPEEPPAAFPLDDLVVPELVIAKSEDGLEIPCQLFLPENINPGEKRPAVIYTHGGPIRQMLLGWHYMHFYSEAYGINQYFANKGYIVLSINYRSGIGYGRSFRNAENAGPRGAAEHQDLLAGAEYLRSRPDVDPGRIGLWGLSYGGVMTAMGLARNSNIFKVGVDMAGVHDWSQFYRGVENTPAEMAETAYESSAVASVDSWTSPVLFIHGDDDRNVPFSQTVDLVQKLREKGDVHIELLVYPDEPHEILVYKSRMQAYNATFDFVHKFLKKE